MTDPDDFRGGLPAPRKTQAYSFTGDQVPKQETKKAVATTIAMLQVMTVEQLMSDLVEVNITAWKSLPRSVRDLMLKTPQKFHLEGTKAGSVPDIYYNGVILTFVDSRWVLDDIVE